MHLTHFTHDKQCARVPSESKTNVIIKEICLTPSANVPVKVAPNSLLVILDARRASERAAGRFRV